MKMTGKCTKHASSCLPWLIKVQLHEPDDDRRGHACPDGAGDLDIVFPSTTCIDRLFPQVLHQGRSWAWFYQCYSTGLAVALQQACIKLEGIKYKNSR
jgi:hypothetical protein